MAAGTSLNQCGVPAGTMMTSPLAILRDSPPLISFPRISSGAVFLPSTTLPPVTKVAGLIGKEIFSCRECLGPHASSVHEVSRYRVHARCVRSQEASSPLCFLGGQFLGRGLAAA